MLCVSLINHFGQNISSPLVYLCAEHVRFWIYICQKYFIFAIKYLDTDYVWGKLSKRTGTLGQIFSFRDWIVERRKLLYFHPLALSPNGKNRITTACSDHVQILSSEGFQLLWGDSMGFPRFPTLHADHRCNLIGI